MLGKRFLPLLLAAVIFILQGGDCVSLFFADQQAHDCCRKGHCSPKNPDPCCQVSPQPTVTQGQVKEKASLLALGAQPVLPAWTRGIILTPVAPHSLNILSFTSSPPGQLGNFSVPLLV
jgi:hypothetical protein